MTSRYSDFLPLKDAVDELEGRGWAKKDAQELLVAALRDGKLHTREWEWDESLGRLRPIRSTGHDSVILNTWLTVLHDDIDWEKSSVDELSYKDLPHSGVVINELDLADQDIDWLINSDDERPRVDKLEISRVDLAKLPGGIEESRDPEQGFHPAVKVQRKQRSRGRKPGDGTIDDAPYLIRMKNLIESRQAKSANDAARQVVEGDAGVPGAAPESKIDRLGRKYRSQLE